MKWCGFIQEQKGKDSKQKKVRDGKPQVTKINHQTSVKPVLVKCCSIVYDAGPSLNQCCLNVFFWLGGYIIIIVQHSHAGRLHSVLTIHAHIGTRSQKAQDVNLALIQCWADVVDGGPMLNQHWVNVS